MTEWQSFQDKYLANTPLSEPIFLKFALQACKRPRLELAHGTSFKNELKKDEIVAAVKLVFPERQAAAPGQAFDRENTLVLVDILAAMNPGRHLLSPT